NLSCQPSLN
ncbi:tRNA synthetases class I family protein, partial [Vibrio parahaemolyticus AQ3810]